MSRMVALGIVFAALLAVFGLGAFGHQGDIAMEHDDAAAATCAVYCVGAFVDETAIPTAAFAAIAIVVLLVIAAASPSMAVRVPIPAFSPPRNHIFAGFVVRRE